MSAWTWESAAPMRSGQGWTDRWPRRTAGDLMQSLLEVRPVCRSVSHLLRALETFQALGIHFVSLSVSPDTSTPAGKMVFTVLGAVAELERSLIAERVRGGLRNAKAKGKRLGRPKAVLDVKRIASLRAQGLAGK